MSRADEVDLEDTSRTPRQRKPKGSVALCMQPSVSGKSVQSLGSKPKYGLPTDGGAGIPSGSAAKPQDGLPTLDEGAGESSGSAQSPGTKPQYGLPTDGGAGGPSGSAGASSSTDAPPPPPQRLEGDSRIDRKKSRDQIRAAYRKVQQRPPATYNPHGYLDVPEICNRIATPWSTQPGECKCETEWPTFLTAALSSGQAVRTLTTPCYDGTMTIEPGQKPIASYRRPGGHNMKERWWYNAILEGLVIVTTKLGHTKTIALVN
jgi:hypothetical protein